MNNEPVSKAKDRFSNYESICLQCGITIYKPQFKTLTDEEIADFEWAIKNVLNFSQSEKVVGLDNVIRAILRKTQEK